MIYEADLSPSKLFIFYLGCMSWDKYNSIRSDIAQTLFDRFTDDDIQSLLVKELEFIEKLNTGWEPDKNECLAFFQETNFVVEFVNQCITEMEEQIVDTNSFNKWFVTIQKWIDNINEDDLRRSQVSIFQYLSFVSFTFNLLPFSSYITLSDNLIQWIRSTPCKIIVFQQPIPFFNVFFNTIQHNAWLKQVHHLLFNLKSKQTDFDFLRIFIHSTIITDI